MSANHIFNRVRSILADIFHVSLEQITADASPDTLDTWDSLNHLNLALALEQEFAVNFTPEEVEQLVSAERITNILGRKLEQQADPV